MKRKIFYLIIAGYIGLNVSAQTPPKKYTIQNGVISEVKKDTVIKKQDKIYQVVNGTVFYQGAKGGIYCWKVSKKTGKQYKSYISK